MLSRGQPHRDVLVLSTMHLLPSSFAKFLSKFQSEHRQTQLPVYNQSQTTLFDDLQEDEKKAAVEKLQRLAAQQPGRQKHESPVRSRRFNLYGVDPCASYRH